MLPKITAKYVHGRQSIHNTLEQMCVGKLRLMPVSGEFMVISHAKQPLQVSKNIKCEINVEQFTHLHKLSGNGD